MRNSKNPFLYRTPLVAASDKWNHIPLHEESHEHRFLKNELIQQILYGMHYSYIYIDTVIQNVIGRLSLTTEFAEGIYPPPFSNNLPPPFKKIFIPPFPILFFQTLNVVMLIALAKSQSARGPSHQPAVMVSCLTISHTCLPCLPCGKVSHYVPGFTEVGSCYYSRKWVWSLRTKLCCMASGK